jgi:hypothetical protein
MNEKKTEKLKLTRETVRQLDLTDTKKRAPEALRLT